MACLRPRSQGSKQTKANVMNANNLLNERKPLLEDYGNVFCNSFFLFLNTCEILHFVCLYNYPGDYRDACALMGRHHLQRKSEIIGVK